MTTKERQEHGLVMDVWLTQEAADKLSMSERTAANNLLHEIADHKGLGYGHIMLYNSIRSTGDAKDGIEDFSRVHQNLMGLHGFMAGFQYIALTGEGIEFAEGSENYRLKAVVVIQTLGFLLSLGGTLISLICTEYLNSVSNESLAMKVRGILGYVFWFRISDLFAVVAAVCLTLSTNLLIPNELWYGLRWILHGISIAGFFGVSTLFYSAIMTKQSGRILYKHRGGENE